MEFIGLDPGRAVIKFEEKFKETFSYCGSAETTYYETHKTYSHEDEEFSFDYKYVVRTNDYSDGGHGVEEYDDIYEIELFLVISPESMHEKIYGGIADCEGIEKIGYEDVVEYGIGVLIGSEIMSANDGDHGGMLNTVASVLSGIDLTRGFYLDRPWNMVGNTGWDLVFKCLFNEDY